MALGQIEVPAMVIDVDREDLMLMSLAENLARRQRTSIEFAKQILAQHERGDSVAEIARKVDLDRTYVRGIIRLLKNGEERLLRAVEQHQIPLSMAIEIAESDDHGTQRILTEAYQKKELRGRALLTARKLLDRRRNQGKAMYQRGTQAVDEKADALVRVYKKETAKLQLLVKRADQTETRLQFVTTAFKKLLGDSEFVGLLKAESLSLLPQHLARPNSTGKGVSCVA
jgi:ParB family chromosome partitioning protein